MEAELNSTLGAGKTKSTNDNRPQSPVIRYLWFYSALQLCIHLTGIAAGVTIASERFRVEPSTEAFAVAAMATSGFGILSGLCLGFILRYLASSSSQRYSHLPTRDDETVVPTPVKTASPRPSINDIGFIIVFILLQITCNSSVVTVNELALVIEYDRPIFNGLAVVGLFVAIIGAVLSALVCNGLRYSHELPRI
jgi:hypothetical protein